MEKIFKEFSDNLIPKSVSHVGSNCGIGKTTLLSIFASEELISGKKVLYLSDEVDIKTIVNKINNQLNGNYGDGLLKVISSFDLISSIEKQFIGNSYDVVIIDNAIITNTIIDYREIAVKYNCYVLVATQLKRDIADTNVYQTVAMQKSDMFLNITKYNDSSLGNRLKYFLLFWLKKPNRVVTIIKNRRGKEVSKKIHLDFK